MQRIANPCTSVRFRLAPPNKSKAYTICVSLFCFLYGDFLTLPPVAAYIATCLSRHPCLSRQWDDWASHEFQRFKIQDGEFPSEDRAGVDVIDVAQYQRFSERGMPCNDCAYPCDT